MASQNPIDNKVTDNDLTVSKATAADAVTAEIEQTDNTSATSNASVKMTTGGAFGGDPYTNFEVTGANQYSFGVDNSDSDNLKITTGASPSLGTSLYSLTLGGDATYPQTGALSLNSGTTAQRPSVPVNGMIRYNSTTNLLEAFQNGAWIDIAPTGATAQLISVRSGSILTINASIPLDDTIPQQTEGIEVITATITPKSSTNRLLITFTGYCSWSNVLGGSVIGALFQDATADALSTTRIESSESQTPTPSFVLRHEMAAGTTSATTFKIRFGRTGSANIFVNGSTLGASLFGGTDATIITILEIMT